MNGPYTTKGEYLARVDRKLMGTARISELAFNRIEVFFPVEELPHCPLCSSTYLTSQQVAHARICSNCGLWYSKRSDQGGWSVNLTVNPFTNCVQERLNSYMPEEDKAYLTLLLGVIWGGTMWQPYSK